MSARGKASPWLPASSEESNDAIQPATRCGILTVKPHREILEALIQHDWGLPNTRWLDILPMHTRS
jgi:hypothetical protein